VCCARETHCFNDVNVSYTCAMELTLPDDVPALVAASVTSASIETWICGVRGIDDPTPVVAADRFHLGSNAKAMTATVTALAIDQGRLDWEDDAADVLGRGRARGATIERLLSHTAGVRPLTEDAELVGLSHDRLEVAALLLEEPSRFEPGTTAEYSNGGYAVVSAVLEQIFGAPFEAVLAERLFDPLGMDAGFGWPSGPRGHYFRDGRLDAQTDDGYSVPPALTGAGDVSSTIDGYARFVQCHLRGLRGTPGLLSVDSFRRLHTPVDGNFALGWGVQEWEGERTSVHAGSAETFYAVVVLQPERDFAAAAVVNAGGEKAAERSIDVVRTLAGARLLDPGKE
jgi:CubicO group peptidase (beta-lactamase class C family)